MFKWAQQQLANATGTQEPIYGPSAIRSVAEEAKTTPYSELKKEDLKWQALHHTCVETQTFYLFSEDPQGPAASVQVIYSNVAGIRTTCQFVTKIFSRDGRKEHLWCSTPVHNHEYSEDKTAFYADDCAVELSEDGTFYTIKSMVNDRALVNLKVTRTAPGFQAGTTGNTLYGTNLKEPWGSMRHALWPRCVSEGTITTKQGPMEFKGRAMFVMALQGMKPHHAAAEWNFVDFQGPTYSAVMMEFTTPQSYGSTVVNVGALVKDDEIIFAGCDNTATHVGSKVDDEVGWPEPTKVKFGWAGKTNSGEMGAATLEGEHEGRLDRVDVMAEVPGFVKNLVSSTVGTKPYVYQYMNSPSKKFTLKIKIGDKDITEEGDMFSEATFITQK